MRGRDEEHLQPERPDFGAGSNIYEAKFFFSTPAGPPKLGLLYPLTGGLVLSAKRSARPTTGQSAAAPPQACPLAVARCSSSPPATYPDCAARQSPFPPTSRAVAPLPVTASEPVLLLPPACERRKPGEAIPPAPGSCSARTKHAGVLQCHDTQLRLRSGVH